MILFDLLAFPRILSDAINIPLYIPLTQFASMVLYSSTVLVSAFMSVKELFVPVTIPEFYAVKYEQDNCFCRGIQVLKEYHWRWRMITAELIEQSLVKRNFWAIVPVTVQRYNTWLCNWEVSCWMSDFKNSFSWVLQRNLAPFHTVLTSMKPGYWVYAFHLTGKMLTPRYMLTYSALQTQCNAWVNYVKYLWWVCGLGKL